MFDPNLAKIKLQEPVIWEIQVRVFAFRAYIYKRHITHFSLESIDIYLMYCSKKIK